MAAPLTITYRRFSPLLTRASKHFAITTSTLCTTPRSRRHLSLLTEPNQHQHTRAEVAQQGASTIVSMMKATNAEAQAFKALHVPGKPLLLSNVHDAASAALVASLPGCNALATASYSIALVNGTKDPELTLETTLRAVARIAAVARATGKPLTVDLQDGYGDRLEEAVAAVIGMGAVGANIEDSDRQTSAILDEDSAVDRVRRALEAAAAAGVPDFVVNARSDVFLKGKGSLDEAIRRARLLLDAGATTAYIMPEGMRDFTREETAKVVRELDGKVNMALRLVKPGDESENAVATKPKPLAVTDLAELGVSRVSIGPQLFLTAAMAMQAASAQVFGPPPPGFVLPGMGH